MLDQALDAAQALGQGEDLDPLEKPPGLVEATLEEGGDHAARRVHLLLGEDVLGMALQAGIDHLGHLGMTGEILGHRHGVAAMAFHAQRQSLQRSEEHTSELQSLMRISYAVLCLKKN